VWEIPKDYLDVPKIESPFLGLSETRFKAKLSTKQMRIGFFFAQSPRDFFCEISGGVGGRKFSLCRALMPQRYTAECPLPITTFDDVVVDNVLPIKLSICLPLAPFGLAVEENEPSGYAGLLNQGATCYMNSILQALFHLPAFRKIVYNMPTEGVEHPEKSIPLNLQRLFCEMQLSDEALSTQAVTKSFGWGDAEGIEQHDIQEFLRVLMDNLVTKMKGTPLEESIPSLFRGRLRRYVRCRHINYSTEVPEDFMDLSITVKGSSTMQESLHRFLAQEAMVGREQYNAGDFGKQDADTGIEILDFPSVLHVHLMRFIYEQERPVKVTDRFEFPNEIDLTEFLAHDADGRKRNNVFDLYGVIVHCGGTMGGHYYAFLRTSTSPQWYQFSDATVGRATTERSISENFGATSYPPRKLIPSRMFDEYRQCPHYEVGRSVSPGWTQKGCITTSDGDAESSNRRPRNVSQLKSLFRRKSPPGIE
jgi:ubiquitin C-terminal hydrolase